MLLLILAQDSPVEVRCSSVDNKYYYIINDKLNLLTIFYVENFRFIII